jgi:hypothetical protein
MLARRCMAVSGMIFCSRSGTLRRSENTSSANGLHNVTPLPVCLTGMVARVAGGGISDRDCGAGEDLFQDRGALGTTKAKTKR